jgi:hypothetical protein
MRAAAAERRGGTLLRSRPRARQRWPRPALPNPGIPANRREAQRLPLIGEAAIRDRELLLQSPELE